MEEDKPQMPNLADETKIKDQILEVLITEGSPQTLDHLHQKLKIQRLILINLIEGEREYFTLTKKTESMAGITPAKVHLSPEGEFLYYHGGKFKARYDYHIKEQRKERWNNVFNIIHAVMLLVFTALAAYGAINNKVFDKKELRLETKIDNQQFEIDHLQTKLKAIPDSIRIMYIK